MIVTSAFHCCNRLLHHCFRDSIGSHLGSDGLRIFSPPISFLYNPNSFYDFSPLTFLKCYQTQWLLNTQNYTVQFQMGAAETNFIALLRLYYLFISSILNITLSITFTLQRYTNFFQAVSSLKWPGLSWAEERERERKEKYFKELMATHFAAWVFNCIPPEKKRGYSQWFNPMIQSQIINWWLNKHGHAEIHVISRIPPPPNYAPETSDIWLLTPSK